MANKQMNYGQIAFLGGLAIAIIVGVLSSFVPANLMPIMMAVLFVLGLAVGLLNISDKEVGSFLLATVALLLAATSWNVSLVQSLGLLGELGTTLAGMVAGFTSALIAFISPAAFIVAILAVYKIAQPD
ncbi:hypothetical protein L0Y65_05340 [Candidatus Micrarchaeota archaeon]|nr:hypothetical protein [Candidatus Micrarchaeota archaeon]